MDFMSKVETFLPTIGPHGVDPQKHGLQNFKCLNLSDKLPHITGWNLHDHKGKRGKTLDGDDRKSQSF